MQAKKALSAQSPTIFHACFSKHGIVLSCLLLCFLTSYSQDLKVVGATSMQWRAGVRGGGGGVRYEIMLVPLRSGFAFSPLNMLTHSSNLILNGVVKSAEGKVTALAFPIKLVVGDTVFIKANLTEKGERISMEPADTVIVQQSPTVLEVLPESDTAEAKIFYKRGKKKRSISVEKFTVLPRQNYP